MKSRKSTMDIKRKVFNEYIMLVITYSSETWALNNTAIEKLRVAQRKMKRIMLGISWRDRKRTPGSGNKLV